MTSVVHDAASIGAFGDLLQIRIFACCWQDKDGATAGLTAEPVDTHSMSRWCVDLSDALYGHESLSFLRRGTPPRLTAVPSHELTRPADWPWFTCVNSIPLFDSTPDPPSPAEYQA
jgi:hypothetical protein